LSSSSNTFPLPQERIRGVHQSEGGSPSTADIIWRLTVCGLGFGLFQSPNNKAIITSAPPERSGGASGMQSSARLLGQSLGAARAAVLFGLVGNPTALFLWLGAGLSVIGCLTSSLRILRASQ
jgi:DHA2 family multidrug resistance protein-like MFS transporter